MTVASSPARGGAHERVGADREAPSEGARAPHPRTAELGLPSSRTRSAWLLQLLLGLGVLVIVLLVLALDSQTMASATFIAGLGVMIVTTAVTLTVPWQNFPAGALLPIPLIDIVAIALLSHENEFSTRLLWALPIIWVASFFHTRATMLALALVALGLLLSAPHEAPIEMGVLRFGIVMLGFSMIALVAANTGRQTRAFKRLLRRQAGRLSDSLDRVRAHERQLSLVLNSVNVGIARVASSGDVTFMNDAYRELFELEPDSPTLPPISAQYAGFRGSSIPPADEPLSRASRGESFSDLRTWLFDSQGDWHALSTDSRRLTSPSGGEDGGIVIVRDITAQLSAERAKENLTRVVSHELRNPLTAVLGYAEMGTDRPDADSRSREQFEMIEGAAERMQHMIDELLDGAAAESRAQTEAPLEQTDLARIVRESATSFDPWARDAGVRVEVSAPASATVVGDSFQLRQVVDNLLSNAVKYSRHDGRVHVRVGASEDGIEPVVLEVEDEGIGIGDDDLAHIFDPYFRADAVIDHGASGTGLGLSIVRDLVRRHGGDVTVDSAPGRGTTMTVRLQPATGPAA
ncbi:PAS domain-containing sensor histidine kinase [Microbacterium sp. LRZ72]|uniref:sensor histidine kinase n=1 Tax=Microbacterium sp. LRZ72 TaxID=2942481 RepID=UPI0029A3A453|nr:ATP-binding protein [Microbacterium sp. LRZ72]MDX2377993.1 PAS domain-containing sensor histidine kinase [Microbacterium sp. LRZ72]